MAKSKIIKDLANGVVDTQTALKRTKVLLQDLGDKDLLNWVSYEIGGYPDDSDVPEYRVVSGQLYGSYFKGSMVSQMLYSNVPLPLGKIPEELQHSFIWHEIRTAIGALKETLDEDKDNLGFSVVIPADFYSAIAHYNNDPYMIITSASVKLNMPQIRNIFSQVESKLLDVLTYFEKKFGPLDELDFDVDRKTPEEMDEIINHLSLVIYNDNSVNIGDNNRIKESTIASKNEK